MVQFFTCISVTPCIYIYICAYTVREEIIAKDGMTKLLVQLKFG